MVAILAAVVVIGIIAICVGPFCYCRQASKKNDNADDVNDSIESPESSVVHIKIRRPHDSSFDAASCECDPKVNFAESTDAGERSSLRAKRMKIVPVKPPRKTPNLRIVQASANVRTSDRWVVSHVWSDEECLDDGSYGSLESQCCWFSLGSSLVPQCASDLSSEVERCGARRTVCAKIEANSKDLESASNYFPETPRCESCSCNDAGGSMSTSYKDFPSKIKSRRLSAVMSGKWKNLKKLLVHSRSSASYSLKGHGTDEAQRLSIAVPSTCRRCPIGHSTMLSKNRMFDRSASSHASINSHNLKYSSKIVSRQEASGKERQLTLVESTRTTNEIKLEEKLPYVSDEIEEVEGSMALVELEQLRCTDGKSICDVKIMGLTLTQSELLQFFEASSGRNQSASIVTTKESAVISIKFHRRRSLDHRVHEDLGFAYECPLKRLCRILPEKLEEMRLSKIFRTEERAQNSAKPSSIQAGQAVENGDLQSSDTSSDQVCVDFSKIEEAVVADEACFKS